MNRNKILALVFAAAVILIAAPLVSAHANLLRSDPRANSAQKISPTRVQLFFSEAIEPSFSSISVLDRAGAQFAKRDVHALGGNSQALEISLNALPLGLYTVAWQSQSAVDGHVTKGSFVFTVGDVPLTDSDPRQFIAAVDAALEKSQLPPPFEIIARWLNILFLVALAGSFVFPLLILFPALYIAREARPVLRGWLEYVNEKSDHPRDDPALATWSKRFRAFALFAYFAFCAATLAILFLQAYKTADGLSALTRILTGTRFGALWLARAAILAALGWILIRTRGDWDSDARQNRALWIAIALVELLILNQSLTSHDAAVTNPPYIGLVIDFIHLAGTAIWIGGLLQLVFTLPAFLRALPESDRTRQLRAVIGCFSLVAFVTVGIIILTGIVSLIFQVGSVQAFFETLYGTSLFLKFILILPLLALGALNLIVARNSAIERSEPFLRRFTATVAVEIALALGIFIVVGVMTSIAPAIAAYDPSAQLVVQTRRVDDLTVTLAVSSGLVGTNDFDVKVIDSRGQPLSEASVVRLLTTHRDMDMGTQESVATNQGDGHYTFRGGILSMAGNWDVEILVRRDGREDARTTFRQAALLSRVDPRSRPLLIENQQALIGLSIAVLGFAIGTASVLFISKKRLRIVNLGSALGVSLFGLLIVYQVALTAPPLDVPIVPIAPPIARTLRSPVRQDPATIAVGKQIFEQNCAPCHGESGRGDGPAAANLNPKPYDLIVHAPQHAEGELFWWVTNGISGTAMVAWESKLSDLQRWQVVQYIRALALQNSPPTPTLTGKEENEIRQEVSVRDTRVVLIVTPRTADLSDFDVTLQNASGEPISDAPRVSLITAMTDMTHGSNSIELAPSDNGHYRARGPWVYMEGKWRVGVVARLKSGETVNAAFSFSAPIPSAIVVSRAIENSATPHQQINVSVYPDTLDLKRVDVPANRSVRVTAQLINASKQDCGGKMSLAELNQSSVFGDAGLAEVSFIAPRSGQLRFKCTKDGLILAIKNSNDPED